MNKQLVIRHTPEFIGNEWSVEGVGTLFLFSCDSYNGARYAALVAKRDWYPSAEIVDPYLDQNGD